MNTFKERTKHSLLDFLQSGLEEASEINLIAKYCLFLSKAYLKNKYFYYHNYDFSKNYNFEEIALDAVVPLFQKHKTEDQLNIIKSFLSWRNPIENEVQAEYFLHKLVFNRTEQHLTTVYKEIDPFYASVLNSVNYLIKQGGFYKLNYLGDKVIAQAKEVIAGGKIIDLNNFDNIPTSIFLSKKESLIKQIFNYIEEQTEFIAVIPVDFLVKRLKEIRINDFIQKASYGDRFNYDLIYVDDIVKKSLEKTCLKVDNFYSMKEKYNADECQIIKNILTNIAEDLKNGGINKSLFDYYFELNSTIDSKVFYKKYYSTINYLIKDFKNTLKNKLEF